jgi:hypothetical protein
MFWGAKADRTPAPAAAVSPDAASAFFLDI